MVNIEATLLLGLLFLCNLSITSDNQRAFAQVMLNPSLGREVKNCVFLIQS